jgi:hypothetical protein
MRSNGLAVFILYSGVNGMILLRYVTPYTVVQHIKKNDLKFVDVPWINDNTGI